MTDSREWSRRRAIQMGGIAMIPAIGAGCLDSDDAADADDESDVTDDEDQTDADAGTDDDSDAEDEESSTEDEESAETDEFEIAPGERILLEGNTGGFVGLEPASIEGEENPPLRLEDGAMYEIGWRQGDGGAHNVVIWDDEEELVADYYTGDSETAVTDDPGDGEFLTFEASPETAYYRCLPHVAMQGELRVGGTNEEEPVESFEIEPGTRIELDGQTAAWVGVEPSLIEGEENPTLVLEDGEEYEIGWVEGDGLSHNIELRDIDGNVVDGLETDLSEQGGDEQFLAFTAGDELQAYVCAPHESSMNGDLAVE